MPLELRGGEQLQDGGHGRHRGKNTGTRDLPAMNGSQLAFLLFPSQ